MSPIRRMALLTPTLPEAITNTGLVKIADGIYFDDHRIASARSPDIDVGTMPIAGAAPPPQIILIFGWMGAQLRHLQTYARAYDKLYPEATQILVRSEPRFWWMTERAKRRHFQPVIEVLNALDCPPSPRVGLNGIAPEPLACNGTRILTHVFSNGGSMQCVTLGKLLSEQGPGPFASAASTSALVFDSCPASPSFRSIRLAFSASIRNPVARFFAIAILYGMHLFHSFSSLLSGKQMGRMEGIKRDMLNPRILPWTNAQTPRLYLFSKKDELVPWSQVQEHANISRERGLNVHSELFENSQHVAHMRAEPKRYWSLVSNLWERACHEIKN
ncbi:hypothetical protein BV22DRAFT_1134666 [Leucogyrophana mollusca]|uniref:Uncharacterized protein n=1 Tax=Leucogyrophana mollusca TaxID=85980 RepID=A0ACB8AY69_9AGAM|nr:hypothetical protein BV22DRAFT_1134666 [Leucogyrophana mollusca]